MSTHKWTVVFTSRDGDSSSATGPCGLPLAILQYLNPFGDYLRRRIADYDTEMRAWHRPDWLLAPTPEEVTEAASMNIIPVMRPGDSVSFEIRTAAGFPLSPGVCQPLTRWQAPDHNPKRKAPEVRVRGHKRKA